MKNPKKVAMGKKSRAQGLAFEKKVRLDLEENGWIVGRWSNNVQKVRTEKHITLDGKNWIVDGYFEHTTQTLSSSSSMVNHGEKIVDIFEVVPAKVTWRRTPKGMFPLGLNSGFPDFLVFKKQGSMYPWAGAFHTLTNTEPDHFDKDFNELEYNKEHENIRTYEIIGVESKITGKLDKEEKEKCDWLLKNNIFSKILIASKTKVKNKIVVRYEEYN